MTKYIIALLVLITTQACAQTETVGVSVEFKSWESMSYRDKWVFCNKETDWQGCAEFMRDHRSRSAAELKSLMNPHTLAGSPAITVRVD